MNERLRNAIESLKSLDPSLSPVARGDAREKALVEGLNGLAAQYGRQIDFTFIDSRGEMKFNITPQGVGYGPELAAWLSLVPRRTGIFPTDTEVLPESSWCLINHFDVERLLLLVGAQLDPAVSADDHSQPPSSLKI